MAPNRLWWPFSVCHPGMDGNMSTTHGHPRLQRGMHFHHIAPKKKEIGAGQGKEDTCLRSRSESVKRLRPKALGLPALRQPPQFFLSVERHDHGNRGCETPIYIQTTVLPDTPLSACTGFGGTEALVQVLPLPLSSPHGFGTLLHPSEPQLAYPQNARNNGAPHRVTGMIE